LVYRTPQYGHSRVAGMAEKMAWLSIPATIIGVLLTRSGQIDQMRGVMVVAAAAALAVAAIAVAAVAAIEIWKTGRTGLGSILRTGLVAGIVIAYPAYLSYKALTLPRMNDISTDIEDAPVFSRSSAAMSARGGYVPPTLEARKREAQVRAYPLIKPLMLELDPEDAYKQVKEAVIAMKWQIIEDVPPGGRSGQGRIEAVAETRLMRFRDDVTVRIRPAGNETRIDIRSASRVGRHDFGANASRIRRLVEEITSTRE
jgi:uncharacterized protein (DUF1499 family)